jgi:hypothetical protein
MGLYVNFRADMIAKGIDPQTASRMAAHWANRYAGALPKEAMSDAATKVSNMLLFSRSFTLGNMGVLKDMLTGLPKDVLAQIERDAGFKAGSIEAGDRSRQGGQEIREGAGAPQGHDRGRARHRRHVRRQLADAERHQRDVQRLDGRQGTARLRDAAEDALSGTAEHPLNCCSRSKFLEDV